MKIVFVICTFGHGRGGHFHSLAVIANALRKHADCLVVNIGLAPSAVLEASGVDFAFERFDGRGFLKCVGSVSRIVEDFEPDVLHSFDVAAHLWARIIGRRLGLPVVHNKCGGPNPGRYYPRVKNLVAFSAENFEYFRAHPKYRNSNIRHIPNRSTVAKTDPGRVARLAKLADKGSTRVLRISRFSTAYRRSLLQTIEFVERLNNVSATRYQLVLIGAVQNEAVFEEVQARANSGVLIVTSGEFTHNASELLAFADIVVATGRGVMEAASLGKPILVPSDRLEYPVLMTRDTFNELFSKNFSPRVHPTSRLELEQVASLLDDVSKRRELAEQSRGLFSEYFSIEIAVHRYVDVYNEAQCDNRSHFLDLALNFAVMTRYFYQARNA